MENKGINLTDKMWRMNNLYKIKDKDGNVITFKLNRAQTHFVENLHTRNCILKARQLGFSTYKCIDALDEALFNNKNIFDGLIIAHIKADAMKLFNEKVKFAWDHLPIVLRKEYALLSDTAQAMRVNLGDGVDQFVNSIYVSNSARSGTYQYIHISELSYLDKYEPIKAEEVMSGALPALSSGGRLDIESTPRGNLGFFYDIFMGAYENQLKEPNRKLFDTEYKPFFYNWTWDDYTLNKITPDEIAYALERLPDEMKTYQKTHKLSDKEVACYYIWWIGCKKDWNFMKQEYPTTVEEAFEAGQEALYPIEKLNEQLVRTPRQWGQSQIFHEPEHGHVYAIGCDVSEGNGRDASTMVVLDFTGHLFNTGNVRVVATYISDSVDPTNFAIEIAQMGRYYKSALVAVERNNHGHATIAKLAEIYHKKAIFFEKDSKGNNSKMGWMSTGKSKPAALYQLCDAINMEEIELNSEILIKEMISFPKEYASVTKAKSGQTKHWDLLVGAYICYDMVNHIKRPPVILQKKEKVNRNVYDS